MLTPPLPQLVALDEPDATNPELTGGKASALATAAAAGLRTVDGVVLTTAFSDEAGDATGIDDADSVLKAFDRAGGESHPLVVRSSSVLEDTATSSAAGQFASVIGVRGYDEFTAAVRTVLDSRHRPGEEPAPMAVLIQPLVEPALGGVLFGIDPVTGRSDRRVINAVAGGPAPLVGGEVPGSHYVLDARGRTLEADVASGATVPRRARRQLVRHADEVAAVFGCAQDVEWAIQPDGTLLVLQSRPVTTEVRGVPSGPIYGPGPVAETFPDPLSPLEADLWVPPLRDGIRHAMRLAGTGSKATLNASDIVVNVGGRLAIDLRLAGSEDASQSAWHRLNPRPALRRLWAAWRVGRLKAALPALADALAGRADADLADVPALDQLDDRQLLAILLHGQRALRSLHAHEVLMGLVAETEAGARPLTGMSVALRVLLDARHAGLDDDEIIVANPVVLSLTAPRIGDQPELPVVDNALDMVSAGPEAGPADAVRREALRLRVRWVHELTARAAWALGQRLAAAGTLATPAAVRYLSLGELDAVITGRGRLPNDVMARADQPPARPLPVRFQLSDTGVPISCDDGSRRGRSGAGGRGAGGGTGAGAISFDVADPPNGSVLVVPYLTPDLAPVLPRLNALVCETGSVLSHLAILAREAGVPTVVCFPHATTAFARDAMVEVDGDRGTVAAAGDRQVAP